MSWDGGLYKKATRRNAKGKTVHSSRYPRYSRKHGKVWVQKGKTVNLIFLQPFGGNPVGYERVYKSPSSEDRIAHEELIRRKQMFSRMKPELKKKRINPVDTYFHPETPS